MAEIATMTIDISVSYTHLDVYKRQMVYSGKLRASKITSRLSLIRKRDIDYLVDSLPSVSYTHLCGERLGEEMLPQRPRGRGEGAGI